ncbi:hypothetical protein ABW21_db0206898 [Orbilia brochopaga]|nr:hypothetical protein ABW21_db0206898 [Drechslerella brochopaga]
MHDDPHASPRRVFSSSSPSSAAADVAEVIPAGCYAKVTQMRGSKFLQWQCHPTSPHDGQLMWCVCSLHSFSCRLRASESSHEANLPSRTVTSSPAPGFWRGALLDLIWGNTRETPKSDRPSCLSSVS